MVDVVDDDLERSVGFALRRRDLLEDGLEEGLQRHARVVHRAARDAVAADRVDDREVHLGVRGLEIDEEVEGLVQYLVGARVLAVDLVDDEDDREAELDALLEDEPRLRERALGGVDEQQRAVGHHERALDLTAEVGVAWRVDDVDLHDLAVLVLPADARVLREDGDSALFFEVVGVHHPLDRDFVLAERAGLLEHEIDESGLAVVDVRDDRDISELHKGAAV